MCRETKNGGEHKKSKEYRKIEIRKQRIKEEQRMKGKNNENRL